MANKFLGLAALGVLIGKIKEAFTKIDSKQDYLGIPICNTGTPMSEDFDFQIFGIKGFKFDMNSDQLVYDGKSVALVGTYKMSNEYTYAKLLTAPELPDGSFYALNLNEFAEYWFAGAIAKTATVEIITPPSVDIQEISADEVREQFNS